MPRRRLSTIGDGDHGRFETSFGYALGLELDTELVLLLCNPVSSVSSRTPNASKPSVGQGWQVIEPRPTGRSRHASR